MDGITEIKYERFLSPFKIKESVSMEAIKKEKNSQLFTFYHCSKSQSIFQISKLCRTSPTTAYLI